MPSQSSFKITVNFEPSYGNITITPEIGKSLSTNYTIKVQGFIDENTPLSYKYLYYFNE